MYNINSDKAKMICEWFHKSYPNYFENQDVGENEILLLNDLEQFIIDDENDKSGQDVNVRVSWCTFLGLIPLFPQGTTFIHQRDRPTDVRPTS